MKRYFYQSIILFAALLLGSVYTCYSATPQQPAVEKDGQVLLPVQKQHDSFGTMFSPSTATNDPWGKFMAQNGKWTVLIDKLTGTPGKAFGKPAQINGYSNIDQTNAEAAAIKFLDDNSMVFNIDSKNLKLSRITHENNLWYVGFSQVWNGMDVILSKVELRIREDAKVSVFYIDYYNNIDAPVSATVTSGQAEKTAAYGLSYDSKHDKTQSSGKLSILPVKTKNSISYKLVYDVRVDNSSAFAKYVSYVDAATGNLIWRKKITHDIQTNVNVQGSVKQSTPLDTFAIIPFKDQYVNIGGNQYTTDNNGKISIDITDTTAVTAIFEGPRAIVTNYSINGKTDAKFTGKIIPGTPFSLLWNNDNSYVPERIQFNAANRAYNFLKSIDTATTVMDYQLTVILYWECDASNPSPNAYSSTSGDTIEFVCMDDPSMRFYESPAVLFHEYGHSINAKIFQSLGRTDGMVNGTCNEGIADLYSCLLLDTPYMGLGTDPNHDSTYLRKLKNDMIYPDSMQGEGHNDGQILSGAFWDLTETVSLDYVRHLHHFTLYGLPDDPDDGTAFSQWFIETLLTDDNDHDLSNGTPHFNEILAAFNRHHIGTNLLFSTGFTHTPIEDTQDTLNPYPATFSLTTQITFPIEPLDSVCVMYSINNKNNYQSAPAINLGNSNFSASIPAQKKGSIVYYYFKAYDKYSGTWLTYSKGTTTIQPYDFLVGYRTAFLDDFETDKGWTMGVPSDYATKGIWERNRPQEADFYGYFQLQPGSDHSESGQKCLVTGAIGGANFMNYLPDGKTTVSTPTLNITMLEHPVIRFYYWFISVSFSGSDDVNLIIQVTPDELSSPWITIDSIPYTGTQWMKYQFRLEDYTNISSSFKMRFILNMPHTNPNYITYLAKGLVDDYEILTTNENSPTSVDDQINNPVSTGTFAYPNPFSETVTLSFPMVKDGVADMTVFNTLGNEVASQNSGLISAGNAMFNWNGTDFSGNRLTPGMYIIKITTNNQTYYQKVVLQ